MRDENGNYTNAKSIADNGPSWADGCPACAYGIVDSMPLTRVADVMTERIVQMEDGLITFCTCQAGQAYRRNLVAYRDRLIDDACKSSMMAMSARRASHPDIDNTRAAMMAAQPAPTIHGEREMA